MQSLSLRLEESVYKKIEKIIKVRKTNRNKFLNEAIAFYANHIEEQLLAEKMKKSSLAIRDQSMEVLKDYEPIDFESINKE